MKLPYRIIAIFFFLLMVGACASGHDFAGTHLSRQMESRQQDADHVPGEDMVTEERASPAGDLNPVPAAPATTATKAVTPAPAPRKDQAAPKPPVSARPRIRIPPYDQTWFQPVLTNGSAPHPGPIPVRPPTREQAVTDPKTETPDLKSRPVNAAELTGSSDEPGHLRKWYGDNRGDGTNFHHRFRVRTSSLNVRNQPSMRGEIIGRLPGGSMVESLEREGVWVRIGKDRWVSMNGLSD